MFVILAAALVAADQLTKLWAQSTLAGQPELPLALGFSLTYTRNEGAAFGIFQNLSLPVGGVVIDGTLLLGLLSASVSLALLVYLFANARRLPRLPLTALTLILAGAAGNMIDRLRLGFVIDFIHFQAPNFDFPVFNVADSCVVIGAGLLLLGNLFGGEPRRESAESPPDERNFGDPDFFQRLETDSSEQR